MNKQQLQVMLEMQDQFNKQVNQDWITAKYKWTDAIMVESVELYDHYGWKWWKKQVPDIEQCQLELVDIWHFIMSHQMVKYNNPGAPTEYIDMTCEMIYNEFKWRESITSATTTKEYCIRKMIAGAAIGEVNPRYFYILLSLFDMTFETLYTMYIGKNALNKFRQDNGYKTGTYVKMWNGVEDNVVLMGILQSIPTTDPEYFNKVYAGLEYQYNINCK
jgi:hypothetical protein